VTWPTTQTIWQAGTWGTVTWTCANLPAASEVYVDLWRNGKSVRYWTHIPVHQGNNSIELRLATDFAPGPDYQIRLSWIENVAICAWSAPFTVSGTRPAAVSHFNSYR
jgi:hypothetical protein